ncbi:protein CLT2, chloroplastic-like isoform X1 [Oryza brachyantha]|uniref:EamA domain-containing protein n=1 Tax=Oryza brachyantha TaxID=4533 RepID=J3LL20_ORYBR|nr:protein CLT2, chloroplastic-like isoform X1 [Oryza brachyantha]
MSISLLLSSPPLPPPLLLGRGTRRSAASLQLQTSPPSPLRVSLAAARWDGGRRWWRVEAPQATTRARAAARAGISGGGGDGEGGDGTGIAAAAAVTVALAVMNRVLYKLALVPMRNYPFFLAQVTTFGYVIVYFSILFIRYHAGIVSKEMLALPKSRFMLIGLLEALGVASGMAAAAMLPGPSIPVLSQSFLVWQLILSVLILGRKYRANQIFGCLLVTIGVILAVTSGANSGPLLSDVKLLWPAVLMASSACHAGASIIKEFVFIDGAKRLEGQRPDIFVVNSFGSGFQALFVFLLLPFLSNLKGIPLTELPAYINRGAACFLNIGGNLKDCHGAPLLPLLFIAVNMAFNISVLNLVKMSTALVASLTATLAVPLSIYVLSLPLPYIPGGTNLSTSFLAGASILVVGLLIYNLPQKSADRMKTD